VEALTTETRRDPAETTAPINRRRHWTLVLMGLWTVFVALALWWLLRGEGANAGLPKVIVHGGGTSEQLSFADRATDWFQLAHLNFARIYPWILFAPYVVWLTSRFYLDRERLAINLPVLLAGCAVFAGATYAINSHVSLSMARVVVLTTHSDTIISNRPPMEMMRVEVSGNGVAGFSKSEEHFTSRITNSAFGGGGVRMYGKEMADWMPPNLLPKLEEAMRPSVARAGAMTLSPLATLLDVLAYGSLAGITHAVHFYRRYRERERRALFLESNLNKARLNALQAQLQPHFLFNTLNAIATLLRRDPKAAEATLTSLSELLRLSLSQSNNQEISLREEMQFLDRYLEIQQTRFGDRLRFEQQIEPAALDCLVPTLLLQPLVENAIRHGIEPSGNPGVVRVSAQQVDGRLAVSVEDDGVGLGAEPAASSGIGLSNLKARLETLYGARQEMHVRARPEGGVAVRITIPLRDASAAQAANGNGKE
jgi:two-component sensor histidine kinase